MIVSISEESLFATHCRRLGLQVIPMTTEKPNGSDPVRAIYFDAEVEAYDEPEVPPWLPAEAIRIFDLALMQSDPDRVEWGVDQCDWVLFTEKELEGYATHCGMWTGDLDFTALNLFRSDQVILVLRADGGVSWCYAAELYHETDSPPLESGVLLAGILARHLSGDEMRNCVENGIRYAVKVSNTSGGSESAVV